VSPDELLDVFARAAGAQRSALRDLVGAARRRRTDRPGQYHLDTVADAAVLPVLHDAGLRVLSEESGWTGAPDATVTVVVDPVDGSTNCARGIPYWGISVCALDADGMLCSLVENGATGSVFTAVRGEGAWLDDGRLTAASTTHVERAVVALTAIPPRALPWRQYRALGSSALALCDVAAGNLDVFYDAADDLHGPWDYLGGALVCQEAGAFVVDARGRELIVTDADARRQLLAACTPQLLDVFRTEVGS
jgi:fructose-1,6-bisphosphatase/inositol monophosphatase family enzyme